MLNRRGFLKALAAIPAAALLPLPSMVAGTSPVAVGFTVGDVFTISGVYSLNPSTLQSTGREQQFVVTSVTETGAVVSMSPQMYERGPYQNVTNLPTKDSRIKPLWVGQTVPSTLHWSTG